MNNIYVI